MTDGPLIVQSDKTLLLEVDHPGAETARRDIAPFAELERAPEHIHTYRVTPLGLWNARAAATWSRQYDTFLGPKACLINEYCFSDGELFPDQFQQMKIGPLIGRRTSAAEIGSDPGWPLVDGGSVSVPNYGAWRPDTGWIIEDSGVKPDYDVASDPNAFAAGKDPQLDKAIAYLLEELRKHPVVRPAQPKDPVRVRSGG